MELYAASEAEVYKKDAISRTKGLIHHLELSKEPMMLWSHISLLSVAITTASAYLLIERREDLLDQYDYVIIGGGLSGLVVANRLTEDLASKLQLCFHSLKTLSSFGF